MIQKFLRATFLFILIIGSTSTSQAQMVCGDHDGNCRVSAGDALAVLRYAVGASTELSCGECPLSTTTTSTTSTTLPLCVDDDDCQDPNFPFCAEAECVECDADKHCSESEACLKGSGFFCVPDGETLYREPHNDGNTFACETCHALSEPAADGLTRPGHPIGVAALRPSFKNGQLASLRDAVNICREDWMATTPFAADDPRWLGLSDYLIDQAEELAGPGPVPALSFSIVAPPDDLSGGNAAIGAETFNQSCIVCHGENAVGSERGPAIFGAFLSDELIATRIRLSGNPASSVYPGLQNGRMPFWSAGRLDDSNVRDLVAFLRTTGATTTTTLGEGGERIDISVPDAQSGCGSTHPSVGSVGMLSNVAHFVAGTVTIVDDCTLHFDDFTYDGGGIRVEMYSGVDGNFFGGRSLSKNILGTPFANDKVELRLPQGVTLDDFNSVSVWCVSAGFSFGDVVF